MRTTLILDDEVALLARDLAKAEHKSISAVISELAREGYNARRQPPATDAAAGAPRRFGRLPQLPSRGGVVTNEHVNALREQLGI
ncbi:MAG: hypothetical protein LBD90_04920 [Bifidobacteriaceae bacterium]|jgi:hypothetical protein|nr:hypothetical protein [Bifidobacteriaceae bacterium]